MYRSEIQPREAKRITAATATTPKIMRNAAADAGETGSEPARTTFSERFSTLGFSQPKPAWRDGMAAMEAKVKPLTQAISVGVCKAYGDSKQADHFRGDGQLQFRKALIEGMDLGRILCYGNAHGLFYRVDSLQCGVELLPYSFVRFG